MPGEPIKFHHDYGSDIIEEKPEAQLPKAPIIGDDPLNSFEKYDWKTNTDLQSWMTYSEETRQKKAKQYANDRRNMDRRHKNLCYIVWYESAHKNGSAKVALQAFCGLFPDFEEFLKAYIKQDNAR